MFWIQDKHTHFFYKVYGWRERYNELEYWVWVDGHWQWLPARWCEPTEPALYTMNLIEDEYDNKFTRYFVGDNL